MYRKAVLEKEKRVVILVSGKGILSFRCGFAREGGICAKNHENKKGPQL